MRDKHGNEIKVGDTVRFTYINGTCKEGVVSDVSPYMYMVESWNDGLYNCPEYVEIVTSAKPDVQPKSLQQLKLDAYDEIQSVIQKHTALINSAGGSIGVGVSSYDVTTLGSNEPKQLVEVSVSVTI